jgi:NADH dehydrogenase
MADEGVKADRLVAVFGGSGFIGRHVVRALARRGWRVRVASRRPELAFHLQPLGGVGQIHAVQANLRHKESVRHAVRDAEAVVNLVGLLAEAGPQSFDAVHVAGAEAIGEAVREAGIETLVHLSAIGADRAHSSAYARTKAAGETAIQTAFPKTVILRPSVVFGPEDQFFNRFAEMARFMPALPLIGGGTTRLQPVFVGDVADAVACAVAGEATPGTIYELGGPEVATFQKILEFILETIERKRWLVGIPFERAEQIGAATEWVMRYSYGLFPATFAITKDQVELLKRDNVVSAAAIAEKRTLQGLGLEPRAYETIVPSYLYRYRKTGQFAGPKVV